MSDSGSPSIYLIKTSRYRKNKRKQKEDRKTHEIPHPKE